MDQRFYQHLHPDQHFHCLQIGSGISLPRFVIEKYSSDYCNVNTSTGFLWTGMKIPLLWYSSVRLSFLFVREIEHYAALYQLRHKVWGYREFRASRSLHHCFPILVSNNFVEAIVNEAIEAGSIFYDVFLPLQLSQKTFFCLHNQGLWCRRGKQSNIYHQSRFEEAQHLLLQYNIISNLGCVWFEVSRSIPGTKLTWFKIPFAVFIVWRFALPPLLLWFQISLVVFGLKLSGSSCPD